MECRTLSILLMLRRERALPVSKRSRDSPEENSTVAQRGFVPSAPGVGHVNHIGSMENEQFTSFRIYHVARSPPSEGGVGRVKIRNVYMTVRAINKTHV